MENLEIMKGLKNTYSGKRVFVTGHTGFKGSWLIKILSDFGAVIQGDALAPENEINLLGKILNEKLGLPSCTFDPEQSKFFKHQYTADKFNIGPLVTEMEVIRRIEKW